MTVKICAIIPFYNHKDTIEKTVNDLLALNLPCIVIDDGCDTQTQRVLQTVVHKNKNCFSQRLEINRGKGGAVIKGLSVANQMGFTHALQVDADGQHNLQDIPAFINAAKKKPQALICGQPVFDDSMPALRKFARSITHFWVAVQTLSLHPIDTMCGFRIYPIAATQQIIKHCNIGKRMDFDIEILVRIVWSKIPLITLPTKVNYPENGVSHFHYWQDNVLITKMHIRLVFGMIFNLPKIIANKKLAEKNHG